MANGEQGVNEAERWFERYLRDHGYEYEYEPDLGVAKRPDFLARRDGVEFVCEVKGFEEPPPLERRLAGTNQAVMVSADEEYGPMRGAVREAARQLKAFAGSPWPLVVVLANPMGFYVHLSIERLMEAMFGNPGYARPARRSPTRVPRRSSPSSSRSRRPGRRRRKRPTCPRGTFTGSTC
jgi:hypothetical protein